MFADSYRYHDVVGSPLVAVILAVLVSQAACGGDPAPAESGVPTSATETRGTPPMPEGQAVPSVVGGTSEFMGVWDFCGSCRRTDLTAGLYKLEKIVHTLEPYPGTDVPQAYTYTLFVLIDAWTPNAIKEPVTRSRGGPGALGGGSTIWGVGNLQVGTTYGLMLQKLTPEEDPNENQGYFSFIIPGVFEMKTDGKLYNTYVSKGESYSGMQASAIKDLIGNNLADPNTDCPHSHFPFPKAPLVPSEEETPSDPEYIELDKGWQEEEKP